MPSQRYMDYVLHKESLFCEYNSWHNKRRAPVDLSRVSCGTRHKYTTRVLYLHRHLNTCQRHDEIARRNANKAYPTLSACMHPADMLIKCESSHTQESTYHTPPRIGACMRFDLHVITHKYNEVGGRVHAVALSAA